jgi:hypothetical protein
MRQTEARRGGKAEKHVKLLRVDMQGVVIPVRESRSWLFQMLPASSMFPSVPQYHTGRHAWMGIQFGECSR